MKNLIATTAMIATFGATQANALSCMQPDVARSFNWVAEAEETYVVLLGQFAFTAPERTPSEDINFPEEISVDARFTGQSLGIAGFRNNAPLDVTVRFDCAGPWCGALPETGANVLAFVERTAEGYVLSVGPCGGNAFVSPSREDVERVESCMAGQGCVEGPQDF